MKSKFKVSIWKHTMPCTQMLGINIRDKKYTVKWMLRQRCGIAHSSDQQYHSSDIANDKTIAHNVLAPDIIFKILYRNHIMIFSWDLWLQFDN